MRRIEWNENEIHSFKSKKESLMSSTYWTQPNFVKPFTVITDASNEAIGAVFAQENEVGEEKMIYAYSKRLDKAQLNYSVTDKELLPVVKSLEHFRHSLIGKEFTLKTDHQALEYLWTTQNTNSRLLRWVLKLQEFSFTLIYIKKENNVADGLSRQSVRSILDLSREGTKIEILNEYHVESGHGSISTIHF